MFQEKSFEMLNELESYSSHCSTLNVRTHGTEKGCKQILLVGIFPRAYHFQNPNILFHLRLNENSRKYPFKMGPRVSKEQEQARGRLRDVIQGIANASCSLLNLLWEAPDLAI